MKNVKFYYKNKIDSTTTINTTSIPSGLKYFLYDNQYSVTAISSNSSDSIDEVIEFVFNSQKTIDTILILNHNFKEFTIQYWDGSAYTNFSTSISQTTNTANHNLFEFNSVTTTKVKVVAKKTQTANQRKMVGEIYILQTIGVVSENPKRISRKIIDNSIFQKNTDNRVRKVKLSKTHEIDLEFGYVSQTDLELFKTLVDTEFLVYLNGGEAGISEFFRIQDVYKMLVSNDYDLKMRGDNAELGDELTIKLIEAV